MVRTAMRLSTALAALALLGGCEAEDTADLDPGLDDGTPTTTVDTFPTPDAAGTMEAGASVNIAEHPDHGEYLTGPDGQALYMFEADSGGESNCYDECATAWPPLTTQGEPISGDPAVQAGMLGTTERTDGTMQVTYNDMPLYYFQNDQGPGDVNGHDIEGHGGEWYLVGPDGEPIGH